MADYFTIIAQELGVPIWFVIIILIWSYTWKLLALWKSARKSSIVWFIVLALVNTVGILEILYIFVFSKINFGRTSQKISAPKRKAVSKPKRRIVKKK